QSLWQLHKEQVLLRNVTSFAKAQTVQGIAIIPLMGHLMDSLIHHDGAPRISVESDSSPYSAQDRQEPRNGQGSNTIPASSITAGGPHQQLHSVRGPSCSSQDDGNVIAEGPSSLSAHSAFAVDFLQRAASSDRENGFHFDTRELLESLGQIVDVLHKQPRFQEASSASAHRQERVGGGSNMPPMDVTAAVIRHGHSMYLSVTEPCLTCPHLLSYETANATTITEQS
ncbi:unnamed protein product, partial [Clonostachys rosea]